MTDGRLNIVSDGEMKNAFRPDTEGHACKAERKAFWQNNRDGDLIAESDRILEHEPIEIVDLRRSERVIPGAWTVCLRITPPTRTASEVSNACGSANLRYFARRNGRRYVDNVLCLSAAWI